MSGGHHWGQYKEQSLGYIKVVFVHFSMKDNYCMQRCGLEVVNHIHQVPQTVYNNKQELFFLMLFDPGLPYKEWDQKMT